MTVTNIQPEGGSQQQQPPRISLSTQPSRDPNRTSGPAENVPSASQGRLLNASSGMLTSNPAPVRQPAAGVPYLPSATGGSGRFASLRSAAPLSAQIAPSRRASTSNNPVLPSSAPPPLPPGQQRSQGHSSPNVSHAESTVTSIRSARLGMRGVRQAPSGDGPTSLSGTGSTPAGETRVLSAAIQRLGARQVSSLATVAEEDKERRGSPLAGGYGKMRVGDKARKENGFGPPMFSGVRSGRPAVAAVGSNGTNARSSDPFPQYHNRRPTPSGGIRNRQQGGDLRFFSAAVHSRRTQQGVFESLPLSTAEDQATKRRSCVADAASGSTGSGKAATPQTLSAARRGKSPTKTRSTGQLGDTGLDARKIPARSPSDQSSERSRSTWKARHKSDRERDGIAADLSLRPRRPSLEAVSRSPDVGEEVPWGNGSRGEKQKEKPGSIEEKRGGSTNSKQSSERMAHMGVDIIIPGEKIPRTTGLEGADTSQAPLAAAPTGLVKQAEPPAAPGPVQNVIISPGSPPAVSGVGGGLASGADYLEDASVICLSFPKSVVGTVDGVKRAVTVPLNLPAVLEKVLKQKRQKHEYLQERMKQRQGFGRANPNGHVNFALKPPVTMIGIADDLSGKCRKAASGWRSGSLVDTESAGIGSNALNVSFPFMTSRFTNPEWRGDELEPMDDGRNRKRRRSVGEGQSHEADLVAKRDLFLYKGSREELVQPGGSVSAATQRLRRQQDGCQGDFATARGWPRGLSSGCIDEVAVRHRFVYSNVRSRKSPTTAFKLCGPYRGGNWSVAETFWSEFLARADTADAAASSPSVHQDEARTREWPSNCRFLVIWGLDSCASTHRLTVQSIDYLIAQLRSTMPYEALFGKSIGGAQCHVQGSLDHHEAPMPVKMYKGTFNVHRGGPNVLRLQYRSLFSSEGWIRNSGNSERVGSVESSRSDGSFPRSGKSRRSTPQAQQQFTSWASQDASCKGVRPAREQETARSVPKLSAVVEFEREDEANAFFHASTYTAGADIRGGRLWSLPDHNGVKFWLHTVLSSLGAWSHASLAHDSPLMAGATNKRRPFSRLSEIWMPFLSPRDAKQLEAHGIALREESPGYQLSEGEPPLSVTFASWCCAMENKSKSGPPAQTNPPRNTPAVNIVTVGRANNVATLLPMGSETVSIDNLSWTRIPKYLHKLWSDHMSSTESSDQTASSPPPHAFVVRLGVFVAAVSKSDLLITPCILSSKQMFEQGQEPFVVRLKSNGLTPGSPSLLTDVATVRPSVARPGQSLASVPHRAARELQISSQPTPPVHPVSALLMSTGSKRKLPINEKRSGAKSADSISGNKLPNINSNVQQQGQQNLPRKRNFQSAGAVGEPSNRNADVNSKIRRITSTGDPTGQ